jgi:hypothetical protein
MSICGSLRNVAPVVGLTGYHLDNATCAVQTHVFFEAFFPSGFFPLEFD